MTGYNTLKIPLFSPSKKTFRGLMIKEQEIVKDNFTLNEDLKSTPESVIKAPSYNISMF